MKVIFLDIDGVMITSHVSQGKFTPNCVENLKGIMKETGALIVVSSTYRQMGFDMLKSLFASNGLTEGLIGMTPMLHQQTRGKEIGQYLEEAELDSVTSIDKFVIIDDRDDMGELGPYLIQTTQAIGLDQAVKERAIAMLTDT